MLMSETSLNCVLSSALVPRTVLGYFTQLQLLRQTDLFTQKAKIVIAALVGGSVTKLLVAMDYILEQPGKIKDI